jgi:DNA-binding PucR family transcriptional regulator
MSYGPETVVYRMDRVQQLTGRTLTETLALSAYEILTGTSVLAR